MSNAYTLCQLLRERDQIDARIVELEHNLNFYLDRDAAVHELDSARAARAAVADAIVALARSHE